MSKLQYNSFTKNVDGQEYCSEIETFAENMIESNEEDATIVYPAPGQWATFRSSENFRITDDGMSIVLPYPVYKIKSLKIIPNELSVAGAEYKSYVDTDGRYFLPDITRFVVDETMWAALPVRPGEGYGIFGWTPSQSNTITYRQGGSVIAISSKGVSRDPSQTDTPLYESMIVSSLLDEEETSKYVYAGKTLYNAIKGSYIGKGSAKPTKWEFQIEYIPMTSATKMKAHKAEPTTQAYTQVVNQRAEVNNAEAFGQYLHLTAQKTGTEKLAIAKIYTKLADVPPIGSVIKHNGEKYRLVSNSWNITNPFTFTVTHLLSKHWSSKSKHISVDQKYRNWAIPFDSYIWRTIYSEAFVSIGENETAGGAPAFNSSKQCIKDMFSTDTQTVKPLRNLFFYGKAQGEGVVVPTTTMAIGNSFIISAAMQDNLSAGLRVSADDSEFCEEVLYCNDDGTLDTATVVLSQELLNYDAAAYPAIVGGDEPKNNAGRQEFQEKLYIDKDPGEALKITIQTHFLPNADWVVIGNALAQKVPYISDKQRWFALYALKHYIRDGIDKVDEDTFEGAQMLVREVDDIYKPTGGFPSYVLCDGNKLSFAESVNANLDNAKANGYVAWVLVDENDNLLIGSNDINKREVYFNWAKKRSRK